MSTDLTFLTNEPGNSLRDRFSVLLCDDTRFFDCLVGYFFISGFYKLYPALVNVEKIRILGGRDIDKYLIKWKGDRCIKYGDHLAEPRPSASFDAAMKIVVRQTGDSLIATIDTDQFVCMNNMHTIVVRDGSCDLSFILGLLNSHLLNYYFQWLNPEKGEALAEVKKENVEKVVIKKNPDEMQDRIIKCVNRVLAIKKRNPEADTSALEQEIDRLVYELYELTPEEIAIVEGHK